VSPAGRRLPASRNSLKAFEPSDTGTCRTAACWSMPGHYMDWSWWQIAVLGAIGFGSYCLILIAKQLEQTNKLLREQSDELRKIENTVSILQTPLRPLTFGDLWSLQLLGQETSQAVSPHSVRAIELAMIASDISRNRTVQLPFLETPSPLYVETQILKDYFPDTVVRWMIDRRGEYDGRVEARSDVIRLPRPQDLPVVFGARLSLSFPVLLSALPLMAPDFAKGKNESGLIPPRCGPLSAFESVQLFSAIPEPKSRNSASNAGTIGNPETTGFRLLAG
jgi:hypothetical protein